MTLHRRHLLALSIALPAAVFAGMALADLPYVYSPGGIAINGFDAVAYFSEGRAVPGSDKFMLKWRGAIWLFASAEHLDAFEMDPSSFAPQYGGYCAFAVANGRAAPSDPLAFAIRNGRLYLNHDQDVLSIWQQDATGLISRADKAWPELSRR